VKEIARDNCSFCRELVKERERELERELIERVSKRER
jgi:hypothetical protein